jgi:hypothetical protein
MKKVDVSGLPKNLRQIIIVSIFLSLLFVGFVEADNFSLTEDTLYSYAIYEANGLLWDDLIARTTIYSFDSTANGFSAVLKADTTVNKYELIWRYVAGFDTSVINDSHTVTSATLCLKTSSVSSTLDPNGTLIISNYTFDGSVGNDDWDNFQNAIYGESSPLSDYSNGDWVNLSINTGIINKEGITYLASRISNEVENDEPSWSSGSQNSIGFDISKIYLKLETEYVPTPTPTPLPDSISVNILEKYSNAALINQAITVTPSAGGAGETKTSRYGETLHFGVVPGMEYWFNASRAGYQDYNETYTIPASPWIYNVYMERILPPIANHSYAHFSVVDQTNGGLIPNAEIRLSNGQTKLTNSAGYAWFSVNNSEQINYYVSKPSGYWPAYGAMNLTADESILVALQRYTGPTATATMPGWTPVTVPTTGTGVDPVVTLSAQLRQQNVQEGMDVWYTNLPFISQFLFLLFIIGGLGLMAGGTRRN